MKVKIDEIRLLEDSVFVRYSVGSTVGRVRLPAAGFEKSWIKPAIKRDLEIRKDERILVEKLIKTYEGQEIEIDEKKPKK